jgi:hypothetical protein
MPQARRGSKRPRCDARDEELRPYVHLQHPSPAFSLSLHDAPATAQSWKHPANEASTTTDNASQRYATSNGSPIRNILTVDRVTEIYEQHLLDQRHVFEKQIASLNDTISHCNSTVSALENGIQQLLVRALPRDPANRAIAVWIARRIRQDDIISQYLQDEPEMKPYQSPHVHPNMWNAPYPSYANSQMQHPMPSPYMQQSTPGVTPIGPFGGSVARGQYVPGPTRMENVDRADFPLGYRFVRWSGDVGHVEHPGRAT